MASTIFTLAEACLSSSELTCPACEQGLKEPVTLSCGHSYCRDPCICAVMTHGMACCMVCNEPVKLPLEKLRVSNALCATLATLRWLSNAAREQPQDTLFAEPAAPAPLAPTPAPLAHAQHHSASYAPRAPDAEVIASPAAARPAPSSAASPAPAGSWACGACTLVNGSASRVCMACSKPAPHARMSGEAGEEEAWQPAQRGGKAQAVAGAWGAAAPAQLSALPSLAGRGGSSSSSGGSGGGGGSGSSSGGGGGAPLRASPLEGAAASASKLIPLVGDDHPPNAVLKTSGAGSSFSKNGRGGMPGTGLLLKFQEGSQQRGMVLTVVTGAVVRKGSHVHGFIGVTRSKNRELFDQIQKTCPEGVREFRNGYVANTRHATLTFQYPDLMLSEEERKHDPSGPDASRIMESLLSKEVFFEVLWSPRWGRFVAHNVQVIQ